MVKRFGLFAFMVMLAGTSHAQQFVTQNQFVGGLVYNGSTGGVTFTQVVNGKATESQGAKPLSFQGFSYLTLKIDSLYYTNNISSTTPTLVTNTLGGASFAHTPDVYLNNGTTQKIKDTIETIWRESGFDIVQDVYPVAFRNSGQIVVKVKIVNHTSTSISVQGQYLLDLLAGSNDYAFMLEQYGYEGNKIAKNYTSSPPTFYMGFEGDPTYLNLGTIGAGYTSDAYAPAPMGLTPCSGMVFGNDPVLATYTFGAPAGSSSPIPFDDAVLMQWPTVAAKGSNGTDSVTEIFRTSYGTQEFCICLGNVIGIGVHPTHLLWNKTTKKYTPNPFNVDELVFNPSGSPLNNVVVTQSVAGSLRIVGDPAKTVPSTIAAGGAASYTWTDSTVADTGCKGVPGTYDMSFDITASGLPPGSLTCNDSYCSVTVDCVDTAPARPKPIIAIQSRTGSFDGSLCNARTTYILATDTNTPPLGFAGATTLSANNMAQIIWAPPHAMNILPIAVHVLDSMLDGQIILRIVGNDSSVTLDTITYCTIRDTTPPVISWHNPIFPEFFTITDSDYQMWDRGLDSVYVIGHNIVVTPSAMILAGCAKSVSVNVAWDTMTFWGARIEAVDCAGNHSHYEFSVNAGSSVASALQRPNSLRIYPNPSADIFTIRVGDADSGVPAQAEVLDVLGRTVARFVVQGTATFDAGALPAGTYVVRVGGMSQRIVKE